MTPDQFRTALNRLRLTQVEAAALLRVDKGTISRWACGSRSVPPPVAVALLLVEGIGLARAASILTVRRGGGWKMREGLKH